MNTDPNAVKILCYGDSNSYGQKPDKPGRYESNVRWTGALQELLGNGYYIVEEGRGSRTINLDYDKNLDVTAGPTSHHVYIAMIRST